MRSLLYSMILYLAGIALVLFIRPTLMFHKDGSWREFSIHDPEGTTFPFWFFCILWALTSYFLVRFILRVRNGSNNLNLASTAAGAAAAVSSSYDFGSDVDSEDDAVAPLPVPSKKSKANANTINRSKANAAIDPKNERNSGPTPTPGYYKLSGARSNNNAGPSAPEYIYIGPSKPADYGEGAAEASY